MFCSSHILGFLLRILFHFRGRSLGLLSVLSEYFFKVILGVVLPWFLLTCATFGEVSVQSLSSSDHKDKVQVWTTFQHEGQVLAALQRNLGLWKKLVIIM